MDKRGSTHEKVGNTQEMYLENLNERGYSGNLNADGRIKLK
jgi:hypothetical protein